MVEQQELALESSPYNMQVVFGADILAFPNHEFEVNLLQIQ